MRGILFIAILCGWFSPAWPSNCRAQATSPEAEVYGGGTKVWGHANRNPFEDSGIEVSATGYFNRSIGLEADLGRFPLNVADAPVFTNHYLLLFGPHFAYHGNRWMSPFGHVLVGVTRGAALGPVEFTVIGRSAFTLGAGGGLDVKVWRFLWIRPIQADYLRESFPSASESAYGYGNYLEKNLRLSAGFVVRFGSLRKAREKD